MSIPCLKKKKQFSNSHKIFLMLDRQYMFCTGHYSVKRA